MSTPRELVYKTLEFNNPERIPRQLGRLPWAVDKYKTEFDELQRRFPDDILFAPGYHKVPPQVKGSPFEIGSYVDEWGCIFDNKQYGIIGEVKCPIVQSWDDIDTVRIPEELLTIDRDKVNAYCAESDYFIVAGCCPRPFERIQFIRGTENVMMDLAMESSEFMELLGRIHDFYMKKVDLWTQTDVDGVVFMDDWGAQRSLLISPDMWRKVFKPLYKDYIDLIHSRGKKAFMHSDGYIIDIIGDLVELGLDALNSQIFCMNMEDLGARFRGKITFWGELDRQHILAEASREEVIAAVKKVHRLLYADGGIIAQMEFGPSVKPKNVFTAFETWESLSGKQD